MSTDGATAVLRDAAFARYFLSAVLYDIGSSATLIVLPVLMYQQTGGPLATALTVATGSAAYLLFGLPAGTVADFVDRRLVILATYALNFCALGAVVVAGLGGDVPPALILGVAALTSISAVFQDAASLGAVPALVGRDQVPAAMSLMSAAGTVLGLGVPALTGVALVFAGPTLLLLAEIVAIILAGALLAGLGSTLSPPEDGPTGSEGLVAEMLSGLRFVLTHPTIAPMTAIGVAQSAFVGAVVAQFVPYADRVFGVRDGDIRLGLMWTVWSAGGLVAAMALPRLLARVTPVTVTVASLVAASLTALAISAVRAYPAALGLILLLSLALSLNAIVTVTFRQMEAPAHMLSRVSASGRMLAWGIGNPTGALLGGLVGAWLGLPVVYVFGAVLGLIALGTALLSPLRRHVGRLAAASGAGT